MKLLIAILLPLIVTNSFASTRNCNGQESEGYKEEYEHHPSKDGSPGFIFIQGSKAQEQYLKISAPELSGEGENLMTRSLNNIKCSKQEMKSIRCAQYTCVINETSNLSR